jgi:hypothetical protein
MTEAAAQRRASSDSDADDVGDDKDSEGASEEDAAESD